MLATAAEDLGGSDTTVESIATIGSRSSRSGRFEACVV
jgi:hypothetical protein